MQRPRPALLVVLAVLMAPSATLAQREPSVLFVGTHWGGCGSDAANELVADGLALQSGGGLMREGLSWDRAKRFNVVVAMGLGQSNADGSLPPEVEQTLDTLRRFLETGGGVLVLPFFGQMATEAGPLEAFLMPLGATPLFAEMVVDPTATIATPWRIPFAETTAFAPDRITENVSRLWVPTPASRTGAQNHTTAAVFSADWRVIARAADSSLTRPRRRLMDNAVDGGSVGTYASAPPIMAVREVGAGRLAYLGITPEYLFGAHAMTTLEGIVSSTGLQGRPSDGLRLVSQALHWLAEPSLPEAELGGAAQDPAMLEDPYRTRFGQPFEWSESLEFLPPRPAFPGVIGARTTRTTGTAGVAEWVAAAREEGLSFLVFLEEFSQLTSEELESLKEECASASGPGFWAIPGFVIDDEVGNHTFYLGPTIGYPRAGYLTEDGARLRSYDSEVSPDDPHIPGQLAMTTLNYAYADSAFKLTAGNYLFSQDAAPFSDFFSNWNATAVITARDGEVIEDATEDYLSLVDSGQGPLPLALHLTDSPSQLAATPWRTVLRLPREGGGLIAGELRAQSLVQDFFSLWHFYPDNPSAAYVTSGPEIEYWGYVGPRDYEGHMPGDFVWQAHRWKLRGRVTSEIGLREVVVRDGHRLFRRYLPDGAREFEFTLDLTHDQQHNFVITATDLAGGRAVSGEQWDRNHRAEEFMCSDRNNQLSYGYLTNSEGLGILIGGNQSLGTPLKRLDYGQISPPGTFRNDGLLGAPAFDGAAGGEPDVSINPKPIRTPEPYQAPDVCESVRLMHTADVHIGEGTREHVFADAIAVHNVWHTLWRTVPAADYRRADRRTFVQIDPDSPVAAFIIESEIELLRDLENDGIEVGFISPGQSREWALRSAHGPARTGVWDDAPDAPAEGVSSELAPGGYAAALDSPLGGTAVFPLTEGLQAWAPAPRRGLIVFSLPSALSPQRKGETARFAFVLAGFPRAGARTSAITGPPLEAVERFRRDLGLDGEGGSYAAETTAGRIIEGRCVMRVDGSADSCFAGRLTGDLITTLPIAVEGLNDGWSATLLDEGTGLARPVGVLEGTAWAAVPLHGERRLFIGHPVIADAHEVVIQATQAGDSSWNIEVHNPADTPVTTTVSANPLFSPLAGRQQTVDLAPGSSVHVVW